MSFRLLEVSDEAEFDAIWPVHFKAFQIPYNTYSKFFNPIHTTLEAAIEASRERNIQIWKANPGCHWIKVVDIDSGDIVGVASWIFHEKGHSVNEGHQNVDAKWHIERSDEKAFAEKLIGGLKSFVATRMTRPFADLNQLIVHPDWRCHGVGRMLTNWGTKKADEFVMETIVVSVPYASLFYEKCGFGRTEQIDIDFTVPNPTEKWKQYETEDLRAFFMWKPAGRNYIEGEELPWKSI